MRIIHQHDIFFLTAFVRTHILQARDKSYLTNIRSAHNELRTRCKHSWIYSQGTSSKFRWIRRYRRRRSSISNAVFLERQEAHIPGQTNGAHRVKEGGEMSQVQYLKKDSGECYYNEDLIYCPLEWQKKGLCETASGYGKKITTQYKIRHQNKMRRVYCHIFSNCGSLYVLIKGQRFYINI